MTRASAITDETTSLYGPGGEFGPEVRDVTPLPPATLAEIEQAGGAAAVEPPGDEQHEPPAEKANGGSLMSRVGNLELRSDSHDGRLTSMAERHAALETTSGSAFTALQEANAGLNERCDSLERQLAALAALVGMPGEGV